MARRVYIQKVGAYLPRFRLTDAALTEVWATGGANWGQRAVLGPDEDTFTMAVEAAMNAIAGEPLATIDACYLVTPDPPDQRRPLGTLLRAALRLDEGTAVFDFLGSERGAFDALTAAAASLRAGECRRVLLVVSDAPLGEPGSTVERLSGAGAAAVLLGDSGAVEIAVGRREGGAFPFRSQPAGQGFTLHYPDPRFERDADYLPVLRRLTAGLAADLPPGTLATARAVILPPDLPRAKQRLLRSILPGAQPDAVVHGIPGHTGAAAPFLDLALALASVERGDAVLLLAYLAGGAGEALWLQVHQPPPASSRYPLAAYLSAARPVNYGTYLRQRKLVAQGAAFQLEGSLPAYWRSQDQRLNLTAQRCSGCGGLNYPSRLVCMHCQDGTRFTPQPLAYTGEVFTFTEVHFGPPGTEPVYFLAMADVPPGVRVTGLLTETEGPVRIGDRVDLVLRRITERSGLVEYGYRFRPQLSGDGGQSS